MATNTFLVEERSRDLGNFLIGRLLPFREKRLVGPFCFIDHMGPSEIGEGVFLNVDQHPHIGLCTLTYLLEGEIDHRDSTGAVQTVTAGSVNLMIAGKGVTHTERTPEHARFAPRHLIHGYQVWIALPVEQEEAEPRFVHISKHELPGWEEDGFSFTLVAGEAFGKTAPTPTFSPLFMVDITAKKTNRLEIRGQLKGEIAIVVVKGSVLDGETVIHQGQMLISKMEDECALEVVEGTQLILFGGKALPEERLMYWNFVSHSKERLEQAKQAWQNHEFPKVPGDETYIPMP
jgi:redox-sensitive bicupin YhaK (pirin superfamily)